MTPVPAITFGEGAMPNLAIRPARAEPTRRDPGTTRPIQEEPGHGTRTGHRGRVRNLPRLGPPAQRVLRRGLLRRLLRRLLRVRLDGVRWPAPAAPARRR